MNILIVDDSLYMRSLIKIALRDQPYNIVGEAGHGSLAIKLIEKHNPDLILLDNILQDMLGIEILEIIREKGNTSKVIMISQMTLGEIGNKAKALGVDGFIPKPFETRDVLIELEKLKEIA